MTIAISDLCHDSRRRQTLSRVRAPSFPGSLSSSLENERGPRNEVALIASSFEQNAPQLKG